ncbi:MAG: DUF4040 domain-containing protein [Firmicutes bacterium]|nr:DUF4040 domain-containing protein [Bacillota bacterium]
MDNLFLFMFLTFLLVASISVCLIRKVLHAVIVFGIYSLVMSIVWLQLGSPDLAITEAAAGIGMSIIMVAVVTKLGRECQ